VRTYREICELFPDEFYLVDCADSGALRSINDIHQQILTQLTLT